MSKLAHSNDATMEEIERRAIESTEQSLPDYRQEGGSKIAAVVIDDWKLPYFREHLDEAGRTYTEHPGITPDTLTLRVQYEWVADLSPIIAAANKQCADVSRKWRG